MIGGKQDRRGALTVVLAVVVCVSTPVMAAERPVVTGAVRDVTGKPLGGVTVSAGALATVTDEDGTYRLGLEVGEHALRASLDGYRASVRRIKLDGDRAGVDFVLDPAIHPAEEVTVHAIRAEENVPVTKKDIDRREIEGINYGQDMPHLLQQSPSMTGYSEAGGAMGYSYFYMRGIHQTRINMTFDGVPLNDGEESAVYFANFGDFASALDSIQIQRGVGTSTVGAASYGGSINFQSAAAGETAQLSGELGAGSFATRRASVAYRTGRLGGGLALWGRATFQETDGFKARSGVKQHAVYFGGAWEGGESLLKFSGFSGREWTELAFLATPADILDRDLRYNDLQPEEKDRFGQDLFQIQYSRALTSSTTAGAQIYYNGAQGWFRLWADPAVKDKLQQFVIDGHAIGTPLTFTTALGDLSVTGGAHFNHFSRDHSMDVASQQQYLNTGTKDEQNAFLKIGWDRTRWHLYADGQVRHAGFEYEGDVPIAPIAWTFFNPKLGARYDLSRDLALYASVGRTTREPTRTDLLQGEDNASAPYDLRAVKPERVVDYEAGIDLHSPRLTVRANVYAMEFHDEIAATGELSEIGNLLRRNVDRSYRRGLEIDLAWRPTEALRFTTTANLSRNRIREWTQFYDVYDGDGNFVDSEPRTYRDVEPLLTPRVIVNQGVEWSPDTMLTIGATGRYVARSYLDNTDHFDLQTPSYFSLDLRAVIDLSPIVATGSPRLRVQIHNALDNRRIRASGYSYQYLSRDDDGQELLSSLAYYYPSATRAIFVTMDFRK